MHLLNHVTRSVNTALLLLACMSLTACGGGGETGGPSISSSSGATGATATLSWDAVQDPSVLGYYVHYGRASSGGSGTCAYEDSRFVSSPTATITNLDHNTRYYFAVSAYNGLESGCSNEVSTVTPAASA